MFEVRCVVGDKKLHEMLRALRGHTLEPPLVIPVEEDAAEDSGAVSSKVVAHPQSPKRKYRKKEVQHGGKHLKGRGSTQVVRDLITNSGAVRISAREMKQATMAAGYSPGAYSHAIKLLVADRTIRAVSDKGDYEVLKAPVTTTAQEAIQNG